MTKALLITLAAVLALPSAASAATANANVHREQGAPLGPVSFNAAKGEVNQVTVTDANGRLRFHDARNRIKAKGDCGQVNANTVLCPFTENIAKVKLGNRDDSAKVEGLVEVLGGDGADVLRGSRGNDRLDGQDGPDTIRGRADFDVLTGGFGRDDVAGGSGDDDLIDGETDASAARDVYRGGSSRDTVGSDRGDQIFYSERDSALDIDLSRNKVMKSAERDQIIGLESVAGGSGDDTLAGDGDDNLLEGNGGDDDVRGRGGADIPMGGKGNDDVKGDDGDDVVWGNGGQDNTLSGGAGDDLIDADDATAETVTCGSGDDDARVTRDDFVKDCEIATKGSIYVQVQPQINGNEATFQVACQKLGGCDGELSLSGPNDQELGNGAFTDLPDDPQTFTPVSVTLTPEGVDAIEQGVIVQVAFGNEGGYRAFMQS